MSAGPDCWGQCKSETEYPKINSTGLHCQDRLWKYIDYSTIFKSTVVACPASGVKNIQMNNPNPSLRVQKVGGQTISVLSKSPIGNVIYDMLSDNGTKLFGCWKMAVLRQPTNCSKTRSDHWHWARKFICLLVVRMLPNAQP